MTVWRNSKMSTLYFDARVAWENHPCTVEINDSKILVEYFENGSLVQYKGTSHGDGHFLLQSDYYDGRATLHRYPAHADIHRGFESDALEGYWNEAGTRGMWRIKLGPPEEGTMTAKVSSLGSDWA